MLSRWPLNLDQSGALGAVHRWSSTRVTAEPHAGGYAQALTGIGNRLVVRCCRADGYSRVSRPPTHVPGALVEVPVDQLDRIQSQVYETLVLCPTSHCSDGLLQVAHPRREMRLQFASECLHRASDGAHLLSDDGEAATLLPRAQLRSAH